MSTRRPAAHSTRAHPQVYSFVFLLFCLWLIPKLKSIKKELDGDHLSASDFSVFVQGLPSDATQQEVLDHFSDLYALDRPVRATPSRHSPPRCSYLVASRFALPASRSPLHGNRPQSYQNYSNLCKRYFTLTFTRRPPTKLQKELYKIQKACVM